jgi:hypothetical protein
MLGPGMNLCLRMNFSSWIVQFGTRKKLSCFMRWKHADQRCEWLSFVPNGGNFSAGEENEAKIENMVERILTTWCVSLYQTASEASSLGSCYMKQMVSFSFFLFYSCVFGLWFCHLQPKEWKLEMNTALFFSETVFSHSCFLISRFLILFSAKQVT